MKTYSLSSSYQQYLNLINDKKQGFKTGFNEFDNLFNGIYKGGLMVLGGRTNHGKTSVLMSLAQKASFEYNQKVLFISTKNKIEDCLARYIAPILNISMNDLTNLSVDNEKLKLINQTISKLDNITFIESINKLPSELIQEIKSQNENLKFDAIFLDDIDIEDIKTEAEYWQEISNESGRTQLLCYLSSLALELDIPILVTTTLKQKLEKRGGDRRPQLKDFKESKSIEKYAHFIGGIYRPVLYLITHDEMGNYVPNRLEINLLKNISGPIKTLYFNFNTHSLSLYEFSLADDYFDNHSIEELIEFISCSSYWGNTYSFLYKLAHEVLKNKLNKLKQ
ncbi:MAG: hypothetical protein RLZZ175_3057 [Bacteroidota bacterium]|jgi:replicative DNA helicase